ncbi:endonuclease VIII Nei2 [Zhihengliuella somnathii]
MPEGDTVFRTARMLDATLTGHELTKSDFRVPQWATLDLSGREVESVCSRGKHLLIRVAELTIHSHLMMDGRWDVYAPGERWRTPGHKVRCVLANTSFEAVGVELGLLQVLPTRQEHQVTGHLGPDPLGHAWDPEEVQHRMLRASAMPIGLAVMDQRNLTGLGNIYRAEVLFICKVHPLTPVGAVPDLGRLIERCFLLLHANKDRTRRKTTPTELDDAYWVYQRTGKPCFLCGTPIEQLPLGPPEKPRPRTAYYCPTCQPVPTRTGRDAAEKQGSAT